MKWPSCPAAVTTRPRGLSIDDQMKKRWDPHTVEFHQPWEAGEDEIMACAGIWAELENLVPSEMFPLTRRN